MRTLAALLLSAALARAEEAGKPPPHLQDQYQEAFQYFSKGEYPKAVMKWEQILQESPTQATARTMLSKARRAIWKVTRPQQEKIQGFVGRGEYQKAQVALQDFLNLDPDDPKLEAFRLRLQSVVEIVPALEAKDRASRAAIRGMSGFLDFAADYQLAFDGLRYALESGPNDTYQRLEELVLSEQPQLAKDEVTPGLTLLDYKQRIALGAIYDARYSEAIQILTEILRLEPSNLSAWERLGSAYFCLGLKAKAALAWKTALKISPDDPGLKKFLNRKKPLKCGA